MRTFRRVCCGFLSTRSQPPETVRNVTGGFSLPLIYRPGGIAGSSPATRGSGYRTDSEQGSEQADILHRHNCPGRQARPRDRAGG